MYDTRGLFCQIVEETFCLTRSASFSITGLPDDASKEAAGYVENDNTVLIDASTAFRVDDNWVYGFPGKNSLLSVVVADSENMPITDTRSLSFSLRTVQGTKAIYSKGQTHC